MAFVYKKAEDIEVLKTWPGSNGITADKCPSEFVYTALSAPTTLDEVFQRSRDIRFGYQLRPEEARIKCLKLLLDRNQKIPSFTSVDDITSMLQAADRSVVDSVADYLSKVKDHTMSTLRSRYGDAFINPTKIQFIMTVPGEGSFSGFVHAELIRVKLFGPTPPKMPRFLQLQRPGWENQPDW